MGSLLTRVNEHAVALARIRALGDALAIAQEFAEQQAKNICQRLLEGESIGTLQADVDFLAYHQADAEIIARFHRAEELLIGKAGQCVMLVTHEEKNDGSITNPYHCLETLAWAGVIAEESLVMDRTGAMFIQTKKHLSLNFDDQHPAVVHANIPLNDNIIWKINAPLVVRSESNRRVLGENPMRGRMIVGDRAVEWWLRDYDHGRHKNYFSAIRELVSCSALEV